MENIEKKLDTIIEMLGNLIFAVNYQGGKIPGSILEQMTEGECSDLTHQFYDNRELSNYST